MTATADPLVAHLTSARDSALSEARRLVELTDVSQVQRQIQIEQSMFEVETAQRRIDLLAAIPTTRHKESK